MRPLYVYAALLILSVALFFGSFGIEDSYWWGIAYEWSKFGIVLGLGMLVPSAIRSFKLFGAYFTLLYRWQLHKEIRFSYSYLFRIKVKNERGVSQFLLVRNSKRNYRVFQPPGGVYKVFDASELDRIETREAEALHEERDIRIRFKGYNLVKVLMYISSSPNIELDHGREFYEELIETEILPRDMFPYLNLKKRGQVNTGIRFSKHLDIYEYNVYDIVDVELTEEQEALIKSIGSKDGYGEQFVLSDTEIIKRCGMDKKLNGDGYDVTEHTYRIIEI